MTEKLAGIFCPHIVPLDQHGQINETELRRYIDWLIDSFVQGLYPNGSTEKFTRFSLSEHRRIVKIVSSKPPVVACGYEGC